jgi:phosphoheptose isomerase
VKESAEDEVSKALKNFQEILKPLRGCTEADRQHIISSLLGLMACSRHSDVVALSKIVSTVYY